jgi:hypothetical protein
MISCVADEGIKHVIDILERSYTKINVQYGKKLEFLGMLFDYSHDGYVSISQYGLVDEIIGDLHIESGDTAVTPASANLFKKSEQSSFLNQIDKERYHSITAKMLYVAKRSRPDILTALSYLTTTVSNPTNEDYLKLKRVGRYLNGTKRLNLNLECSNTGSLTVNISIDAALAIQPDGKSQTGSSTSFGNNSGGSVECRSSKQQVVAKGSSEAELIGVSDELSPALWLVNFIKSQGYKVQPINLHQDNRSTIAIMQKGHTNARRLRHLNIRYFFVKDYIERGELVIVNDKSEDMVSDFFTKPLQGYLFKKHRKTILNLKD